MSFRAQLGAVKYLILQGGGIAESIRSFDDALALFQSRRVKVLYRRRHYVCA